jgi:hypothetical protein
MTHSLANADTSVGLNRFKWELWFVEKKSDEVHKIRWAIFV